MGLLLGESQRSWDCDWLVEPLAWQKALVQSPAISADPSDPPTRGSSEAGPEELMGSSLLSEVLTSCGV